MTNIIAFPKLPTARPQTFTAAERDALIACANSLPGDVEASFERGDNAAEWCALVPRGPHGALATVEIDHVGLTLSDPAWPFESPVEASRDVADIVAALGAWLGKRA